MEWLTDSMNYNVNSRKHPNIENNTEYIINSLFSSKYLPVTIADGYSITSQQIQRIKAGEAFTLKNLNNIPTKSPIYIIINNISGASFSIGLETPLNGPTTIDLDVGKNNLQIKNNEVTKI